MKQWLTSPGSSCIECSRLFPFSCSTFSKSSFCYKQSLGQRHQSQCQCIRVHHYYGLRLPELSQKCHPSIRGSTRSLLRTLCTAFTFVGFLHWIKESGSLQSHSLAAFFCRGGQSVITHFCVDKLSELQISLVGELISAITLLLIFAGNSHSVETSETDSGHGRVTG